MNEDLRWHVNGQLCPKLFFIRFLFLSVTLRKMSIIFRLQGVCTYLVPINIQQYGAEQENNRASNLCLVLHNVCIPEHSVATIRKRKALNLNCTFNSNIYCNIFVSLVWAKSLDYQNAYSVLSLVPLKAWDFISLKPFLTRFLPRTQCYKFQFAVKSIYHQGRQTEHSNTSAY